MGHRRKGVGWPVLALTTLLAAAAPAAAQAPADSPGPLPEAVSPQLRERVRFVMDKTTLSANGPVETFVCSPAVYNWLLDHPDQAARLWRLMGVKCADIRERAPAAFAWEDGQGS